MNTTKSIDFIKSKTIKNIDFKTQISREKISSLTRGMVVPSDYSYDYLKVKPKISTTVDFSRLVGREAGAKNSLDLSLAYTSYDFNKYVWGGNSNVYPNTKTHVIDLRKQSAKKAFHRLWWLWFFCISWINYFFIDFLDPKSSVSCQLNKHNLSKRNWWI